MVYIFIVYLYSNLQTIQLLISVVMLPRYIFKLLLLSNVYQKIFLPQYIVLLLLCSPRTSEGALIGLIVVLINPYSPYRY